MPTQDKIAGSYPNPNIPNEEKGAKYILDYLKAAYQAYINDQHYGYSNRANKINNKRYRLSEEDVSIYKTRMNISGDTAYMNLDFSPLSIVPSFVDTVVNSILEKGFEIKVNARDSIGAEQKEAKRKELLGNMLGREMRKSFSDMLGHDLTIEDAPTSIEEIELRMDVNYRDDLESALEQAIREVRSINKSKELDRYVLDDLVTCGEGCIKVTLEPTGNIEYRYIDAVNLIRSFSFTPDNRRIKHTGHVTKMTIGELRSRAKNDEFDEVDWEEIASRVSNRRSGYKAGTAVYVNNSSESSAWYDSVDVDVVELEFVDFNYDNYEYKETDYGFNSVHKRPSNYKLPVNSKKERRLVTDTYETVYKGSWIVGTDFIFDYGKLHNISIDANDMYKASTSYIIYTIYGKSLVQKIIPYAELIQLIHLKIQQLSSKARPSGLAINVSALENAVSNGHGGYFEPLELTDIYDETGNLYYRSDGEDPDGRRGFKPIEEIRTSIKESLESLVSLYNHYSSVIRQVSGVNDLRDGTNTHPKTLVGVQQEAIKASNNSTYAIDAALNDIIVRTSERTIEFIQDIYVNEDFENKYEQLLGSGTMEVIERIKNIPLNMVGIEIEFEPTVDEKTTLEKHIEIALNNGEIGLDDAIMIREIDNTGIANRALITKKKKNEEKASKMAQARLEMEKQQKAEDLQNELIKKQKETDIELHAEIIKAQELAKIEVMKAKELAGVQTELLGIEYAGKENVARITAGAGMEKQRFVEDRKDSRDKNQKTMESSLVEQRKDRLPIQDFRDKKSAQDLPSGDSINEQLPI